MASKTVEDALYPQMGHVQPGILHTPTHSYLHPAVNFRERPSGTTAIAKLDHVDGVTGSTVLALVGVLLGTSGTLVGQHLATRVEVRRDQQQRADTERTERKEAILGFLAAVQQVELILDRRGLGLPAPEDPEDQKLHDLWLAKKAIELVCSYGAGQAAHDYTKALHSHMRNAISPEQLSSKRERRYAFMEVARDELGSGRPRIRR